MAKGKIKKEPETPEIADKGKEPKKLEKIVVPKRTKQEKIELQNLLFGTSEKKLMVSDEFLNNMAVKYISKRMKAVNSDYESIHKTKIPEVFFKSCDEIENNLEDLIRLEPYYSFKNPIPTVYKRNFLNHKPEALTAMLNRVWNNALQKYPLKNSDEEISEKAMEYYDETINEMLKFQDRMSESDLSLIDSFYKQVHGEEEEITLTEESADTENEVAENNEAEAENAENPLSEDTLN